jgi:hypothetical protein
VKPTYAGRAPSYAGEDQIDFAIPADVVTGCYVPMSVTASGQVSQDFVIPIAKSGSDVCTHIFGLNESALATLDSGGTVNVGLFQILVAYVAALGGPVQGAGGLFDNANASAVFNLYNLIPVAYGAVSYPAPLNSCVIIDQVNTSGGFNLPPFNLIGGTELVADAVTLFINPAARVPTSCAKLPVDTLARSSLRFSDLVHGQFQGTGASMWARSVPPSRCRIT